MCLCEFYFRYQFQADVKHETIVFLRVGRGETVLWLSGQGHLCSGALPDSFPHLNSIVCRILNDNGGTRKEGKGRAGGCPSAFLCDARSASADFLIRAPTGEDGGDGGCTATAVVCASSGCGEIIHIAPARQGDLYGIPQG